MLASNEKVSGLNNTVCYADVDGGFPFIPFIYSYSIKQKMECNVPSFHNYCTRQNVDLSQVDESFPTGLNLLSHFSRQLLLRLFKQKQHFVTVSYFLYQSSLSLILSGEIFIYINFQQNSFI